MEGGQTNADEVEFIETGRDLLAHYAASGYTVEDVVVEHPVMGDRPKRAEVTVELTLTEPVSSVLDRMEHGGVAENRRQRDHDADA
ncbi:hypothetical protein [Natronobiforma cellulositropha]|uniref:hypothetical protein n=1 Tax=Natronobiforma cellulositropha TaxID=1679076 RepID=UPI0021D5FB37|nr:hypothetical protein [Natronobiforma cellulositropha]